MKSQIAEEIALQLCATEYALFYNVPPLAYIHYVCCEATDTNGNPSPVTTLVRRHTEISSWATQLITTQPTHPDRIRALACLLRVIDACLRIAGFNAALTLLAGLKSRKLRCFWLSLKGEERRHYEKVEKNAYQPNK